MRNMKAPSSGLQNRTAPFIGPYRAQWFYAYGRKPQWLAPNVVNEKLLIARDPERTLQSGTTAQNELRLRCAPRLDA
jgi:hypothetical protein